MIELTFSDGKKKKFQSNVSALEVLKKTHPNLLKKALAVEIDGTTFDLETKIDKNALIKFLTFDDEKGREIFWHSSSHVMASAVKELWPNAKLGIGPAIAEGFYYDFDVEQPFSPEDLKKIEEKMKEIVSKKQRFERKELSKKDALSFFKKKKENYKVELIEEISDEKISFYSHGNFTDFCRGPHVPHTGYINCFKLLKVSGAYWKGDEKNKMLQRIYGISFPEKSMLKEFLERFEEAKKRNHVKLGKELDLFSFHSEAPAMPFFHGNGMILWNTVLDYLRKELLKRGYEEISTPLILKKELWLKSGHWEHYRNNMYFTKVDEEEHAIKPMNCPGCILVYKENRHSYKEFPIMLSEFGIVHRHELSGVVSGLFRVRGFTQDDAHVFCLPEQTKDEIKKMIQLVIDVYSTFSFKEYHVELSTKPLKYMGSDELWEIATKALEDALKEKKINFKVNEGEGAFYGPKIDFHVKDSLGRSWQCATIQVDFSMPEKFDLYYIGKDDKKHRPVMIHRAILGSMERFIGILIEHFAGEFPAWLSPVQTIVIPISENHSKYAKKVEKELQEKNIRAKADLRNETVSYRVRDAQLKKVPYILVVGDKEKKNKTVNVRARKGKVLGEMKLTEFAKKILREIEEKK